MTPRFTSGFRPNLRVFLSAYSISRAAVLCLVLCALAMACAGDDSVESPPGIRGLRIEYVDHPRQAGAPRCLAAPLNLPGVMEYASTGPICEVLHMAHHELDCNVPGKSALGGAADERLMAAIHESRRQRYCPNEVSCETLHFCRLHPLGAKSKDFDRTNPDYQSCMEEEQPRASAAGYCYIDPDSDAGHPDNKFLKNCPMGSRRILRLVPDGEYEQSIVLAVCHDEPL